MTCDSSRHFRQVNRTCTCIDHYHVVNGECVEICGDGKLFSLACDDGNSVDGDGCSSSCEIESYYACASGTATTPSHCVYQNRMKLVLESIKPVKDANRVVISFQVTPATGAILKLNISSCLKFSTDAASSLQKIEVSPDRVLIYLDFYESLVGNPATLKLKFDSEFIRSPSINLKFGLASTTGQKFAFDPEAGTMTL